MKSHTFVKLLYIVSFGLMAVGTIIFVSYLHYNSYEAGRLRLYDDPTQSMSIWDGQVKFAWMGGASSRDYKFNSWGISFSTQSHLLATHYRLGISGLWLFPWGIVGLVIARAMTKRVNTLEQLGFPISPANQSKEKSKENGKEDRNQFTS